MCYYLFPPITAKTTMASPAPENVTNYGASRGMRWLRALPCKSLHVLLRFGKKSAKIAKDDPRRVTHSLKVGLALTVVSLFFFLRRLYDSFGDNALWAVMTVVVVMEFSVGATLGKGLNRMLATLLGGFSGVAVQQLSTLSGGKQKPILIALFLYIIGALITFMRFFPQVKARYDYGLTIFILTFSLVLVSGYREDQILDLAFRRLSTIIIGSFIAIIICVFLFPAWSGDDLHNLLATNLEKLGNFLEGFGTDDLKPESERSFAKEYESVLTSKTREETLANFARWEPCHGQIRFRHPWQKCLELGNLTRQCAYKAEALDVYLRYLIKTSNQVGLNIKDSCQSASLECGKALKMLSSSVKSMTCLPPTTTKAGIEKAKGSIELIHSVLRSKPCWEGVDELKDIVAAAAVTSLLSDMVICIERIIEAFDELSNLAHFKCSVMLSTTRTTSTTSSKPLPLTREGIMKPVLESHDELSYCAVTINDGYSSASTKEKAEVVHP